MIFSVGKNQNSLLAFTNLLTTQLNKQLNTFNIQQNNNNNNGFENVKFLNQMDFIPKVS